MITDRSESFYPHGLKLSRYGAISMCWLGPINCNFAIEGVGKITVVGKRRSEGGLLYLPKSLGAIISVFGVQVASEMTKLWFRPEEVRKRQQYSKLKVIVIGAKL